MAKGFQKGNTFASLGKGVKKKKTQQWEALGEAITSGHTERFNKILRDLDDDRFADRFLQILEYFKPKLARQEVTDKDGKNLKSLTVNIINSQDELKHIGDFDSSQDASNGGSQENNS